MAVDVPEWKTTTTSSVRVDRLVVSGPWMAVDVPEWKTTTTSSVRVDRLVVSGPWMAVDVPADLQME